MRAALPPVALPKRLEMDAVSASNWCARKRYFGQSTFWTPILGRKEKEAIGARLGTSMWGATKEMRKNEGHPLHEGEVRENR